MLGGGNQCHFHNTERNGLLSPQARPVDRFKHSLCTQFVMYMNAHKISQQELANLLGVDKSIASKIVHYHFDDFTSDRLIKYLSILDPNVKIEVKARVA